MFLKIAGLILAGYTLVFGLFVTVALQSGVAIVDVANRRDGSHVFVPVPMVLGSLGLSLLPAHVLRDAQREIGPHHQMMEAAIQELRECPDGPFVEVEGRREHVLIEKSGDNLVVNVHSKDEDVYVKLPLRGAQRMISQLAAKQ